MVLVLFVLSIPRFIKINSIDCQSQEGDCSQYLAGNISSPKGSSLYRVERELKQILKKEVLVNSSSIQYNFPDKLKIYVIIKKPVFAVRNSDKNIFALVDSEGHVVSLVQNTNLPYVEGDNNAYSIGQKIGEETVFALGLLDYLDYLYQTKRARIENGSLHIELEDGTRVIFPLGGNEKQLVGSLRLVLSQKETSLSGKTIREIDLRFKNPVLR